MAHSVRAWHPKLHWGQSSVLYFRVVAVDETANSAVASLLDPCFPANLGSSKVQRFLVDLGTKLELQGNHVDCLQAGFSYVAYGTVAPLKLDDGSFRIYIPRCSAKAGVSRILGTGLATFQAENMHAQNRPLGVAELFCGGMGGWTQAIKKSQGLKTVLALDSDPLASKWFIRNNGGYACLQGDYFEEDFPQGSFPVFTCDIQDKSWYQAFLRIPCDVVSASFPCTPWSTMGAQHGLQGQPGQALLAFLQMLRILQPMAVVLENVPGFRSGPGFTDFSEQLQLAGYQIMFSTVDELANVAAVSRRRWLAVAVSTLYLTKPESIQSWARPVMHKPLRYQPCFHSTTFDDRKEGCMWDVTHEERQILHQFPVAPDSEIPSHRVIDAGMLLPTYTASYRASLQFASHFLKSKGLYAWLVRDAAGQQRWFSPLEAALNMGFPLETVLPASQVDAVRLVGNAIAPPQAALALVYLERMLHEQTGRKCMNDFLGLFQAFGHHELDFRELAIVAQDSEVFICQKALKPSTRKRTCETLQAQQCGAQASAITALELPPTLSEALDSQGPTLTYPDAVYGRRLDGHASGFRDPYGAFVKLPPFTQPIRWRDWVLQSNFKKSLSDYMLSFETKFIPDSHVFMPGYMYTLQLHRIVPGGPGKVSGVFDLQGDFRALSEPGSLMPWKVWLQDNGIRLPADVWATADGLVLTDFHVLKPHCSQVIRLRPRLKGGTGSLRAKLGQHLLSKGVPQEAVDARIKEVMGVITEDQLQSAYRSLEPWAAIKGMIGNKVRLVTAQELRENKKKTTPKAPQQTEPDPWQHSDPWSEAKATSQAASHDIGPLQVSLIPGFFTMENGDPPAVLHQILRDSTGICLLPQDQALAFCGMQAHVSQEECAAVVIGSDSLDFGKFPATNITFPAQHPTEGKVLLKGVLVNFGAKAISQRKTAHDFDLDPRKTRTLTFEIARPYTTSWDAVCENPMRFIWKHIGGAQAKILTSWSRKFFLNRNPSKSAQATSFHCFAKTLESDLEPLLLQSGHEGIFMTPKAEDGSADGSYRIVWMDSCDKSKALAMAGAQANILGIVKGKTSLGLRVLADFYTQTRQAVEPGWVNDKHIRYQVKVVHKFLVEPLPQDVDREALQKVLDKFGWNALPLKPQGDLLGSWAQTSNRLMRL